MRLRLRIERNELPAVNVLWTVDPTALKQTVAQFLQRVDERVPLEGESWGLEDYAVEVGGYEAFHYSEVGDCFQNEDEVIIKPLQYVDVRARSMTGRDQISSNGMHLMDGVPFGKPLLKRPRRPDVRIPPRKRARLEVQDGDEENDALEELRSAIMAAGQGVGQVEDEDEDDEEDDEDFDMAEDEDDAAEEDDDEDGGESSEEDQAPVKPRRSMRQRLVADEAEECEDDDTDESDSDSSDDTSDEGSTSSESSDDSSSESDDASSEASWNGIQSSPAKQNAPPVVNGHDGTSMARLSSSDAVSFTPPFEGTADTKMRNARRRDQRRLKYLKETGVLTPDATMDDMRMLKQLHGGNSRPEARGASQGDKSRTKDAGEQQTIEEARQRLVESIAAGGIDVSGTDRDNRATSNGTSMTNGDQTRSGARNVTRNGTHKRRDASADEEEASENDEPPDQESSAPPAPTFTNFADENTALDAEETPGTRRARINLAGANRLVFGSLGVRTPRSQADKDALQKKLSARASRNVPGKEVEQPPAEVKEDEDPEAWREKIALSAVECCDEGVELSTPPFPFQQRWDPQYQYSKKRKKSGNSKAAKARKTANGANDDFVESYDKYNTNGGSDALNYDDPEDDAEDDSYWEEGALLGDEDQESIEPVDDGFPSLPEDLTTLADAVESDAREGDFITYKQLVCSAATKWTPTTVNRTAKLASKTDDGSWNVVYATRDKRPKQFDDEGNRVYSKFEMEGMSDDEDEEVENILAWTEMQEPKLLKRAATEL